MPTAIWDTRPELNNKVGSLLNLSLSLFLPCLRDHHAEQRPEKTFLSHLDVYRIAV